MNQVSLIRKTKYIYYTKVNKAGLTLCQKKFSKRDKFLHDYQFDLEDKTCHFDGGQFVAAPGIKNCPKALCRMSFLDVAACQVKKPYSPMILYNLPVQKAKIYYHKEVDTFTCTYNLSYCGSRTVLLEKLPPALKNLRGKDRKLEYGRVVDEIHNTDATSIAMNLKRSGSVPSIVDNHCCSYECVWKMLNYNKNYIDKAVSTEMIKKNKRHITLNLRIFALQAKKARMRETLFRRLCSLMDMSLFISEMIGIRRL